MKDRKGEIIQATLELSAENGLGTVSMQQIADRVGITKASLYNHFASRDEIVESMYERLRLASREKAEIGMAEAPALKDVLTGAVNSYKKMVSDPQMFLFYKIIMSERSINKAAAEIMAKETKTMIDATKTLFYALQVKGLADFGSVDPAAFSFAMAIHAIIEYEFDLEQSGMKASHDLMCEYIDEFCRVYAAKEG